MGGILGNKSCPLAVSLGVSSATRAEVCVERIYVPDRDEDMRTHFSKLFEVAAASFLAAVPVDVSDRAKIQRQVSSQTLHP